MTLLTPEENQGGGDDSSTTAAVDSEDEITSSLALDSVGSNLDTDDLSPSLPVIDNPVPCLRPVLDSQEILSGLEREKRSPSRFSVDVECESIVSDYSELGGPLRDIERDVNFMDKDFLKDDGFSCLSLTSTFWEEEDLERREGEKEEDFERRVRKVNLLSLAQEFAELKKVDSQACAINFHRNQSTRNLGRGTSPFGSRGQSLERSGRRTTSKSPLRGLDKKLNRDKQQGCCSMSEGCGLADNVSTTPAHPDGTKSCPNTKSSHEMVVPKKSGDLPANEARRRDSSSDLPANMRPERCVNSPSMARNTRTAHARSREGSLGRSAAGGGGAKNQLSQGSSDYEGDFDVYNIETTLPQMNWEVLEKQLQAAAEDEKNRLETCKNEREEIRRRLAMSADEDLGYDDDAGDAPETLSPRKQRIQARLQGVQSGMQICFMNDDGLDDDDDDLLNEEGEEGTDETTTEKFSAVSQSETSIPPPNHPCFPGEIQEFTNRQTKLQSEATLALAQASTMARMQLEVEKQGKKKSPIADMVGIPTLGQGRRLKLTRGKLQEMNIAQLQVLVNDLHSQIELLNEDLVHLLIERDDLHMEQDSMLVDIEDLTSHCHDPKATNNNKSTLNNNRPSSRRDRHK